MPFELNEQDQKKIDDGIRAKYIRVAANPEGQFRYPTGLKGLSGLDYDPALIEKLPERVARSYCGVGNPFSLGVVRAGDRVLDIGCGCGVDTLLASFMVGPTGAVMGIDITPEMIDKAKTNQKDAAVDNVIFRKGRAQDISDQGESFDVVISNGVFNLIPEKEMVLDAIYRLLKPGGKLFLADQFFVGRSPKNMKERIGTWFQ